MTITVNGKTRAGAGRLRSDRLRLHARTGSHVISGQRPCAVSARAGIVVTGTEVLTGRVRDRNGPWLADRLLELGVELAHITICGDRPEDMEAQLRFMAEQGMDLIVTSGGLGPDRRRPDDGGGRRASAAARWSTTRRSRSGSPTIVRAARWRASADRRGGASRRRNRKQAMVPEGATMLEPAGTAPGAVVRRPTATGRRSSCCRARRASCRRCGPRRSRPRRSSAAIARARRATSSGCCGCSACPSRRSPRRCAWRSRGWAGFDGLEITTCLRRGEIEVVVRYAPRRAGAPTQLEAIVAERHAARCSRRDGHDDRRPGRGAARGPPARGSPSRARGGLLAARLTERPGVVRLLAGRRGRVLERGEDRAARASTRS